ncbi:MAG: MaoC/PaaZ C-terminal domain-containing protein [Georgenia sp.]
MTGATRPGSRATAGGLRAGGPPPGYGEEVLPAVPPLGALYARAIGRSRALVMSSRPLAGGGLPQVVLRADGVRADAAQLTRYQHVIGEPGTDELPAGYVHVLAFPLAMAVMVRADFPLPVLGMVHIANRVVQRRALVLGEELDVRAWAEALRAHPRGTQVDVVVSVRVGVDEVWRGTSTYLAKGRHLDGAAPEDAHPAGTPAGAVDGAASTAREASGGAAAAGVPPVGAGAPPAAAVAARWRLAADTGRRYATVSGDRNPIHISKLGARLFGFPRPIAHGMYTAARALAAVRREPGPFEWTAEFAKPVLLPSDVILSLTAGAGVAAAPDLAGGAAVPTRSGTEYSLTDTRSGRLHVTGAVRPI